MQLQALKKDLNMSDIRNKQFHFSVQLTWGGGGKEWALQLAGNKNYIFCRHIYPTSNAFVSLARPLKISVKEDVAHIRGMEMHTKFWLENLQGRDHSENQAKMKRQYWNRMGRCGLDSPGSYIKGREFLDQLSDH
jgi:hypothetical protein